MKYVVTITEVGCDELGNDSASSNVIRYQQTVDKIDIQAVINAVNTSPVPARAPRKRARRSDAGKPRKLTPVA
jgi:hypothetical protein